MNWRKENPTIKRIGKEEHSKFTNNWVYQFENDRINLYEIIYKMVKDFNEFYKDDPGEKLCLVNPSGDKNVLFEKALLEIIEHLKRQ